MPGMTINEVNALGAHVERQGVRVTRTKSGLLLRLPNNDTEMVHYTSSDVNQRNRVRQNLKRAGITLPENTERTRKPTRRTRRLVRDAVIAIGDPETVRIADIRKHIPEDEHVTTGAISNVLNAWGYFPSGARTTRRYHRPDRVSWLPEDVPVEAGGVPAVVVVDEQPARDEPAPVSGMRIDVAMLPDDLTIAQVAAVVAAMGCRLELTATRAVGSGLVSTPL